MNLDINEVAEAIGIPIEQWAGNCFGIACAMVEAGIVEGTALYGHWIGPIHPRSYFSSRAGHRFCQHGWIETEDGEVVDPTRWAFENKDPYIYIGIEEDSDVTPCQHCGHIGDEHTGNFFSECKVEGCDCPDYEREVWPYDEGGNRLRCAMRKPLPDPNDGEREFELDVSPPALSHVLQLLNEAQPLFTSRQLHWIATLPYDDLGPWVSEIYAAYNKLSHFKAYIPLDNRLRAERETQRKEIP